MLGLNHCTLSNQRNPIQNQTKSHQLWHKVAIEQGIISSKFKITRILAKVDILTNHIEMISIPDDDYNNNDNDDYDAEDDHSSDDLNEDISQLANGYKTIDLNDFKPNDGFKKSSPKKNSYQKIVLKEFPTTTTTTTAATTDYENDESEGHPQTWPASVGLKPPTPPFSTLWADTQNGKTGLTRVGHKNDVNLIFFPNEFTLLNKQCHRLISRCNFEKLCLSRESVNKLNFVYKQVKLFQNHQFCIKIKKRCTCVTYRIMIRS